MENYNLESARELINSAEKELSKEFEKAEEICEFNSEKVLKAFQENRVNEADFGSTTGYGYGDIGRIWFIRFYVRCIWKITEQA